MAKSRAFAFPGKLDDAARVMRLTHQKNQDGKRLLDKFSIPRNPTKADPRLRIRPEEDPVDAENLYRYNVDDILAEAEASAATPNLEGEELEFWHCDQEINTRGVQMDRAGIDNCIAVIEQAYARYNTELAKITDGVVQKASELQKLIGWLGARGTHTDSLDVEHVEDLLKMLPPHPPGGYSPVRRVLEIRERVGSAAVKKLYAMRNQLTADGRLHDLFSYHAAHTGRATGNGPQPTNLPNSAGVYCHRCECGRHYGDKMLECPWCGREEFKRVEWNPVAAVDALQIIASRSLDLLEMFFGDAVATVSGCLRALFIAADGYDLICSDYSAIEAVCLAFVAEEKWRMEVFETHGKIYEMSAAKTSGKSFAEFMNHVGYTDEELSKPDWYMRKPTTPGSHHPLRKTLGKVGELASGYQGWIGAWIAFGADAFMNQDEMKAAILGWRAASPAIVYGWGGQQKEVGPNLWVPCMYGLEGCAIAAVTDPGSQHTWNGITYQMRGDVLFCRLLSGRELKYHAPRLCTSNRPMYGGKGSELSLSYEGWNTNPKNGPPGWIRKDTWGGRLMENVIQAIARDILRFAIVNLERAGYRVVLHVYDEIICEIRKGWGSIEEFERIMATMPDWCAKWPIRATDGWRGPRYGKA